MYRRKEALVPSDVRTADVTPHRKIRRFTTLERARINSGVYT